MTVHAVLGASSAKRWFNCPGSVDFIRNQPETHLDLSSEFADEGTFAHELAEACLINGYDAKDRTEDPLLADAVQEYLDAVRGTLEACLNPDLKVEVKFRITFELFGTNDAAVWDDVLETLWVFDYKHGAGVFVPVEENIQLVYYALGAIKTLKIKPKKIIICIAQPRCNMDETVRYWELPEGYIEEFEVKLGEAVERVKTKGAPMEAGSHCQFCPAIAVCPAYRTKVIQLANSELLAVNFELGQYLSKWKAAIDRVIYKALISGKGIPGLKLVQGKSNRKWKDAEGLGKELKDNEDAFTPQKLKSPAQLEKILTKKFVAEHCFKPEGGLSIAPESDKREAKTKVQNDFADVEVEE